MAEFGITKNSVEGLAEPLGSESLSSEATRRGNAAMNAQKPRSYTKGDETFTEERDRLGRDAMSKLPPRKYQRDSDGDE